MKRISEYGVKRKKIKLTWQNGYEVRTLTGLKYVISHDVADNQDEYAEADKSFWALSESGVYRRAKLNAAAKVTTIEFSIRLLGLSGSYATDTGDVIITIL